MNRRANSALTKIVDEESFYDFVRLSMTSREQQILELMCDGLSNQEIARRCRIQPGTVKTHQQNLYNKVGASSRSQAIVHALRNRLVVPPWMSGRALAQ